MKNNRPLRRGLSALVMFAVMLGLTVPVFGSNAVDAVTASLADKHPAFLSFTGSVIEVRPHTSDPSRTFVTLEDKDEALATFIVSANTYLPDGLTPAEGMTLTGWYDAARPMTMIYPPQHEAAALRVFSDEPPFVKVDRFDAGFVSNDALLKLNIGEDTPIITANGEDYNGSADTLEGKPLMVFYAITTRSIPAQTPPLQIVVLNETGIGAGANGTESSAVAVIPAAGTLVGLSVNGEVTEIALALGDDDAIMVPLYLVCQGLGLELTWDDASKTATVDGSYDAVVGGNAALIEESAGVYRTYVPLEFFTETMGLNNAYFFEGQIVIDNGEKMR